MQENVRHNLSLRRYERWMELAQRHQERFVPRAGSRIYELSTQKGNIEFDPTATANRTLTMAGSARNVIEKRSESVSTSFEIAEYKLPYKKVPPFVQ
jgi:hypothetical protein